MTPSDETFLPLPSFDDFGLSPSLQRSLREMGFEEPTPVQARAIPFLMRGQDVVAQALTGTGKTAAYGIPLVERLDVRLNRPQAVVLTPTRELAIQVAEHLDQLGRHLQLRFLPVYGGQPIDRQLRALSRGVHGIVATPGRLMDHMRRGTIELDAVKMLVLDEADQMLQMGFQEDVEYIVSHIQSERLTALLSATMPKPILDIVRNYMHNPEMIHLSKAQALTVPEVKQIYYQVPFPQKFDALCRILDVRSAERTIVFCSTKRMVDEIVDRMPSRGYMAEGLHGDVNQNGRERILKAFRDGRTDVLVATDVAARGLDIPEVSLVINFDIPPDPEYYVHRIGRTGRSGRSGEAITFVNPREMRELSIIERATGAPIIRGQLPTPAEAEERETEQLAGRLRDVLERGAGRRFRSLVDELATEHDAADVAAAALALINEQRVSKRAKSDAAHTQPEMPDRRREHQHPHRVDHKPQTPRPHNTWRAAPRQDRPGKKGPNQGGAGHKSKAYSDRRRNPLGGRRA